MGIDWWIWWLIFTGASTLVGAARGQTVSGLVWGALLGPLGIIIVLFLPNKVAAANEIVQRRKETEQTALLKRTLAAQEEQIRLLRAMAHTSTPSETHPPAVAESLAEEAAQLEDFVPESMKGKPPLRNFEHRR